MRKLTSAGRKNLHRSVRSWYQRHRRALRWRETTDPYEILVSEVMLQQTQVQRVQEKLPIFLDSYPTFSALAKATRPAIIRAWQGMGYNSRALRLLELARIVERDYDGRLPSEIDPLLALPGIGPYSAHAVACFAMKKRVPVVDVNIRRVFSRLFWKMKSPSAERPEGEIWEIARAVLPSRPYIWNQALMDLGATICTRRRPMCPACPISRHCASRTLHTQAAGKSHARKRQPEPMFDGIPRRIWRGRIVQRLRMLEDRQRITLAELGRSIRGTFSSRELGWLSSLVAQLQNDGLVRLTQTPKSLFVSLAHE